MDIVLAAFNENGFAVHYGNAELQHDKEIILAAL